MLSPTFWGDRLETNRDRCLFRDHRLALAAVLVGLDGVMEVGGVARVVASPESSRDIVFLSPPKQAVNHSLTNSKRADGGQKMLKASKFEGRSAFFVCVCVFFFFFSSGGERRLKAADESVQ